MKNRILLFAFYSMILNALFRPLNGQLTIVFGYITILLSLIYPFVAAHNSGMLLIDKRTLLLVIVLIISMISSLGSIGTIGTDNAVISIISLIAFYWSLSISGTKEQSVYIQDICRANYFLCAILLVFGYGPFGFKYTEVGVWGYKIFTMGLGNPNTVSVYVMFSMMLLLIQTGIAKNRIQTFINILLIASLFYLLILLSSRTVVACVILLLTEYVVAKRGNHIRYYWIFILACPIIMIVIQQFLGNSVIGLTLLGKAIETGRSNMFNTVISDIKSNPMGFIFGKVFSYQFENLHNAPLTIVANLGFIGLIVYLTIWFKKIKSLNEICNNKIRVIALYSILAFIIQSSSEALLMVGSIPYGVMVIIIDRIAKGEIIDKYSIETTE